MHSHTILSCASARWLHQIVVAVPKPAHTHGKPHPICCQHGMSCRKGRLLTCSKGSILVFDGEHKDSGHNRHEKRG
jgi:hypothetical protein